MRLTFAGVVDCFGEYRPAYYRVSETAPASLGVFGGFIADKRNEAVEHALVTLYDLDGGKRSLATGSDGSFSFAGLKPGKGYWLRVERPGYFTEEFTSLEVQTALEAVYEPFHLEPCRTGHCGGI